MELILTFTFFLIFTTLSYGQMTNPKLDPTLAKKLGGDDYGMKMYVFVVLKGGDNKTTDKKFIDSCFEGHLANITRLAALKQIVVAGPFGKNESGFRGLFIINVPTIAEANKLLETDPAIKANLLKAELYPWYGSAALPEYLEFHDKIWKSKP